MKAAMFESLAGESQLGNRGRRKRKSVERRELNQAVSTLKLNADMNAGHQTTRNWLLRAG